MLNRLTTECVIILSLDAYPQTFSQAEIEWVKKLKQNETGGLALELQLKIGARVMLISNIDIDDRLINGQLGTIVDFKMRFFYDNEFFYSWAATLCEI